MTPRNLMLSMKMMRRREKLTGELFQPACAVCGKPSAVIEVIPPHEHPVEWRSWDSERQKLFRDYRDSDRYYLLYDGPGGGNGWVGDPTDPNRAEKIAAAFKEPYCSERI